MRLNGVHNCTSVNPTAGASSISADSRTVIPSKARYSAASRGFRAMNPGWIAASLRAMRRAQTASLALCALLLLLFAPSARAEYIVLQSGLRLHVSGYQLLGDKYHLQLQGGWMDVSVADVVKVADSLGNTATLSIAVGPAISIAPGGRTTSFFRVRITSSPG